MQVVFRAFGTNFDVESFLGESRLEANVKWHKGDKIKNWINPKSGFNIVVYSSKTRTKQVDSKAIMKIEEFLRKNSSHLKILKKMGAESIIDMGIITGDFISEITFGKQILRLLAQKEVKLIITVFP